MITSAEEAKKILHETMMSGNVGNPTGAQELWSRAFAKGYLQCLKGKEVAALVEALEKIRYSLRYPPGLPEAGFQLEAIHLECKKALAQYRESIGEKS